MKECAGGVSHCINSPCKVSAYSRLESRKSASRDKDSPFVVTIMEAQNHFPPHVWDAWADRVHVSSPENGVV